MEENKLYFESYIQSLLFKFKRLKKIIDDLTFIKKFENIYEKFIKEVDKFQDLMFYLAKELIKEGNIIIPKYIIFKKKSINDLIKDNEEQNCFTIIFNSEMLNIKSNLESDWENAKEIKNIFENIDKNDINYISLNEYFKFLDLNIFNEFIKEIEKIKNGIDIKKKKLCIVKVFLIFIKKLEILFIYFEKVLYFNKNDIYSQSINSDTWMDIKNHTNFIVF